MYHDAIVAEVHGSRASTRSSMRFVIASTLTAGRRSGNGFVPAQRALRLAATASPSTKSFIACPECPFTHWNAMSSRSAT